MDTAVYKLKVISIGGVIRMNKNQSVKTQDSPAAAVVADCRVAGGGRLGAVSFGRNGHT